jgi:hypothetical protein
MLAAWLGCSGRTCLPRCMIISTFAVRCTHTACVWHTAVMHMPAHSEAFLLPLTQSCVCPAALPHMPCFASAPLPSPLSILRVHRLQGHQHRLHRRQRVLHRPGVQDLPRVQQVPEERLQVPNRRGVHFRQPVLRRVQVQQRAHPWQALQPSVSGPFCVGPANCSLILAVGVSHS